MKGFQILHCPFCGTGSDNIASMPAQVDNVDVMAIKCLSPKCTLEGRAYIITMLPETFGKDVKVQEIIGAA